VVLRVEDERDRVADRGVHRGRSEHEPAVADLDLNVGRRRGGGGGDGGESSGGESETHLDSFFFFVVLFIDGRMNLSKA